MKILHLADLHFGKSLHNVSLIESGDQPHWVEETLKVIRKEKPDVVVIAGDVYDRGVPSREAVQLLDEFLTNIAQGEGIPVLLIAGNHDGGERLEFGNKLLQRSNVYIAGTVKREIERVDLQDEYGTVTFWLLPFLFPAAARTVLGADEGEITSYTEGISSLLKVQDIDYSRRNVIVAHQMVIHGGNEPKRGGSETAVGGVGGVNDTVFDGFDYVALGHIHGAQNVGRESVRYAGAPLCYHFSEANQKKGLLFVTLNDKNEAVETEIVEIKPLHRVRPTMTGEFKDVLAEEEASTARGEYVRIELTDSVIPKNAREILYALLESHECRLLDITPVLKNISREDGEIEKAKELSPDEYFSCFYREQRGETLTEKDMELIKTLSQQVQDNPDRSEAELIEDIVTLALRQEGRQ